MIQFRLCRGNKINADGVLKTFIFPTKMIQKLQKGTWNVRIYTIGNQYLSLRIQSNFKLINQTFEILKLVKF